MSDLGDLLAAARTRKGLTVNQAALETHIRANIIEALEAGSLNELPPPPFARGLLRTYSLFLGLEPEPILYSYSVGLAALTQPAEPRQDEADGSDPLPANLTIPLPPPSLPERPPILPPLPPRLNGTQPAPSALPSLAPVSTPLPRALPETIFQVAPDRPVGPRPFSRVDAPTWVQSISNTRLPELVAAAAVFIALIAFGLLAYSQFRPGNHSAGSQTAVSGIVVTPSPVPEDTETPLPTPIPSFVATSPAATDANAGPPPTRVPRAPTAIAPSGNVMTLEINATDGPMQAWVVVDNVEAFKGVIDGESRTWTASKRLYFQVQDLPNGTVTFDGKEQRARVFQERKLMERAWEMNAQGAVVAVNAVPFLATPSAPPPPTSAPTLTSTPTP